MPVLVIKDRNSRCLIASVVLHKGRGEEETVDQAVDSIRRLGHRDKFILKTDNEPALISLRESVANRIGTQVIIECSPLMSSPATAQ